MILPWREKIGVELLTVLLGTVRIRCMSVYHVYRMLTVFGGLPMPLMCSVKHMLYWHSQWVHYTRSAIHDHVAPCHIGTES